MAGVAREPFAPTRLRVTGRGRIHLKVTNVATSPITDARTCLTWFAWQRPPFPTIHTFGWPIGVVLHVDNGKPMADADGVVARITSPGFSTHEDFDYWALRLNGDFYLAQNLFEDQRDPAAIFFNTRMVRTAEALLYCRNLYNNLGLKTGATIQFRVRHSGIKGRNLSTSNPNRLMWPQERKSAADASERTVEFDHPLTDRGVVEKTRELLNPLFVLFDFFEPAESIYQHIVGNFIRGRCT